MAWYIARTKTKGETVAQINLERQSYKTYLPVVLTDRRFGRKTETEPMFAGYLFVQLIPGQDDFAPIRSTVGVLSLVRFGIWPAIAPDSLIDLLKQREDASGIHRIAKFDYSKGDKVVIRGGVFDAYQAIVQTKKSDRIIVLVDIISQQARLELTYRDLEPLTA